MRPAPARHEGYMTFTRRGGRTKRKIPVRPERGDFAAGGIIQTGSAARAVTQDNDDWQLAEECPEDHRCERADDRKVQKKSLPPPAAACWMSGLPKCSQNKQISMTCGPRQTRAAVMKKGGCARAPAAGAAAP